jgi:hypothetical protein
MRRGYTHRQVSYCWPARRTEYAENVAIWATPPDMHVVWIQTLSPERAVVLLLLVTGRTEYCLCDNSRQYNRVR